MMIILENLQTTRRLRLFTLFGVDWLATPYAWVSLPLHLLFGIVIAFALDGKADLSALFWRGAGYGLLIYLTALLHTLGHIASSRLVHAPLKAHLFTATFPITLYDDRNRKSKWIHIGRSLGGPLIHWIVGLALLLIYRADSSPYLAFFILVNLIAGIWVLFPLPSLDGWVIWGELLGFRHSKKRRKRLNALHNEE